LSTREVAIWKEKLKETVSFVTDCLGHVPEDASGYTMDESFDEVTLDAASKFNDGEVIASIATVTTGMMNPDPCSQGGLGEEGLVGTATPSGPSPLRGSGAGTKSGDVHQPHSQPAEVFVSEGGEHDENLLTSQNQSVGQFFDDAKERKSLEILEAVMKQELLVDDLPSVPQDEFFDPIDLEIETRLQEIKSFRQSWYSEVIHDTDSVDEVPLVKTSSGKPKRNKADVIDTNYEAVYSSQEDSEAFNSWYNDKVNTEKASPKSKPEDKSITPRLSSIPEPSIPSGPQSPKPSACKVDVVNTSYAATCQDKLGSNPTIIPNMANMQVVVMIIALTILNLVNKSKPQFHHVPAAFPMPTTSYPYPITQPSSLSPSSQFMCEPSQPSCYCVVAYTVMTRSKARVVDMTSSVTRWWKGVRVSVGKVLISMARAAAGDGIEIAES
jgi:hypothetical protein